MSLYEIIEEIKKLLEADGFICFDINEFENSNVSRLAADQFPAVFIGRGIEEIDNEASPIQCLIETANIDLNIVFNTGRSELEADSDTALRKVKNVIYANQATQNWENWVMTSNYVAQLANTNERSAVYGGININTLVRYREERYKQIEEV